MHKAGSAEVHPIWMIFLPLRQNMQQALGLTLFETRVALKKQRRIRRTDVRVSRNVALHGPNHMRIEIVQRCRSEAAIYDYGDERRHG